MKLKETIFDLNARFPSLAGKRTHVVRRDGAFQKLSEQGRGRLVPAKRRATEKTRGRGRPRPTLERTSCGATRIETFLTQSETSGKARGLKSPMGLPAFASRERKDLSAARCTGFFPFTPALSLGERVNRTLRGDQSRPVGFPRRDARCSLSPRERVRVRGNGAKLNRAYFGIFGTAAMGEFSGRAGHLPQWI